MAKRKIFSICLVSSPQLVDSLGLHQDELYLFNLTNSNNSNFVFAPRNREGTLFCGDVYFTVGNSHFPNEIFNFINMLLIWIGRNYYPDPP